MVDLPAWDPIVLGWRKRLFGVACDAAECDRWLEAYAVFDHLAACAEPDLELCLHWGRSAARVGELGVAKQALTRIDGLWTATDAVKRSMFFTDVQILRTLVHQEAV